MSKIGNEVMAHIYDDMGQPQIPKLTEQLPPFAHNEVISPAARARNLVDQQMEADPAFQLGWIMYDLESRANDLNAFTGDLTAVKDEIDTVIAKLTKVAEKLQ